MHAPIQVGSGKVVAKYSDVVSGEDGSTASPIPEIPSVKKGKEPT
jgi:hypothetical protein